jgi:serine/threonine protein kinase
MTLESIPPPFTEQQALAIVSLLLDVLAYLATPTDAYAFVLHRDIKPENTLVDSTDAAPGTLGKPVLCDFGGAVKVQHDQQYPSMVGDVGVRARELSPSFYIPRVTVGLQPSSSRRPQA